jgi:hypothetical protein
MQGKLYLLESDFVAQKNALYEIILTAGHKCVFYFKFHCELNFIEMSQKNLYVKL